MCDEWWNDNHSVMEPSVPATRMRVVRTTAHAQIAALLTSVLLALFSATLKSERDKRNNKLKWRSQLLLTVNSTKKLCLQNKQSHEIKS